MTEALPIIDVGAFREKRASAATAREIEKACREFGFFYATGHGVGGETVNVPQGGERALFRLGRQARWRSRSRAVDVPGGATFP